MTSLKELMMPRLFKLLIYQTVSSETNILQLDARTVILAFGQLIHIPIKFLLFQIWTKQEIQTTKSTPTETFMKKQLLQDQQKKKKPKKKVLRRKKKRRRKLMKMETQLRKRKKLLLLLKK